MRLNTKNLLRLINNDLSRGFPSNNTYKVMNHINYKSFKEVSSHFLFRLHMTTFSGAVV